MLEKWEQKMRLSVNSVSNSLLQNDKKNISSGKHFFSIMCEKMCTFAPDFNAMESGPLAQSVRAADS